MEVLLTIFSNEQAVALKNYHRGLTYERQNGLSNAGEYVSLC
jgi:hypothetical protein